MECTHIRSGRSARGFEPKLSRISSQAELAVKVIQKSGRPIFLTMAIESRYRLYMFRGLPENDTSSIILGWRVQHGCQPGGSKQRHQTKSARKILGSPPPAQPRTLPSHFLSLLEIASDSIGTNRPAWSPFGNRHPICIAGKVARLHAAKHDPNRVS